MGAEACQGEVQILPSAFCFNSRLNRIIPSILSSSTALKVAFANRLMASPSSKMSESVRRKYSKVIITDVWKNFVLEPHAGKRGDYEKHFLTSDDLASLIQNTISLNVITEDKIRQRLEAALKTADKNAYNYALLPFVGLILEQKVQPYRLDENTHQPNSQSMGFVTQTLEYWATVCIGKAPERLSNWSKPQGGCHKQLCFDCKEVNRILRDPEMQVGQIYNPGGLCKSHLDRYFPDDASYTMDIESGHRMCKIIKKDSKFETWMALHEASLGKVKSLMQAGSLKSYLGEAADDILSLNIEGIEKSKLLKSDAVKGGRGSRGLKRPLDADASVPQNRRPVKM